MQDSRSKCFRRGDHESSKEVDLYFLWVWGDFLLALFCCRLNLNWALFFSFCILKELCENVMWILFSVVSCKELQNGVGLWPAPIDRWDKDRLLGKRSWKMVERVGYSRESRLLGIGWIAPNRIWIRICSTINEFKRGMDVVLFFLGETPFYLVYPTNYFDPLESSRTHRRRKILRPSFSIFEESLRTYGAEADLQSASPSKRASPQKRVPPRRYPKGRQAVRPFRYPHHHLG